MVRLVWFLVSFVNTHAWKLHISFVSLLPISEPTHTNRHPFHSRRPTVFLWHQQTDYSVRIYQIPLGIWHLWVLFFIPILHRFHSVLGVLASPPSHHSSEKVWGFDWAVAGFWEKLVRNGDLIPFSCADQFCALRETAGETCISTRTWLHIAWGRHLHSQTCKMPKTSTGLCTDLECFAGTRRLCFSCFIIR